MEVLSVSPLRAASVLVQARPATWVLTAVAKATYMLAPGEATLAPEQEEPNEDDNYWDDNPARSIHAPSDLVPFKPRADVILVGHAFSPGRQPVRSLGVRLIVGDIDKSIEVFCDRIFTQEGALQEGQRFTKMQLVYERAAGGPGTWNPVGVRQGMRDNYGRTLVPNLQPVGFHVTSPNEFIEPVGLGPIAPSWPMRVEKLGRHASTWSPAQLAERPLPEGFDPSYFNAAPRDQQLAQLRDNERLVIENLHLDHSRLVTNLPGIRPATFVDRGRGQPPQRLLMRADTLWIDTDRSICTVTWRGQLSLERPDEEGRVVIGLEPPGREVTWTEVERNLPQRRSHTLPFLTKNQPTNEDPRESTISPYAARSALPFAPAPQRDERPRVSPGTGLPFQSPQSPQSAVQSSGSWSSTPVSSVPTRAPAEPPPASSPWANTPPPPSTSRSLSESWGPGVTPPAPVSSSVAPSVMPPPSSAASPISPPAVVPTPAAVVAPPSAARAMDSPWASGAPLATDAPQRETVGSVAVAAPSSGAVNPSDASRGGAAAASTAAAAAASWSLPQRDLRAVKAQFEVEPTAEGSHHAIRLIWFDPESVPRMRRVPRWKPVLDALEDRPVDRDFDDPAAEKDPLAAEDRREVFEILARGSATDSQGAEEALAGAIRDDGKFVPPLVLLAGEVEFPFDELEALKAAVSTASPLVTPTDEGLKASIDIAKEFLQTPGLASAPNVSEGLTNRIREAFAKEKRALPGDYLDTQMERILLTERRYQKREVLGDMHLRFLLQVPGDQNVQLGYVPDVVTKKLPMFRRFLGRVIAEVHLPEDQYEVQSMAFKVVALARVTPTGLRR